MGKKKKKTAKPWCYYCEREFEDEKILIQHQKAKHFKCHVCHKKLSTAGGMVVHVLQVHKENMTKVPNARPGRESVEIEIFGMEGIPPEAILEHTGEPVLAENDERPAKTAKVEVPPPPMFGMASQPYSGSPPVFLQPQLPSAPRPIIPPSWPPQQPPPSQPPPSWPPLPSQPVRPPGLPPIRPPSQPLFPIQGSHNAPQPPPSQPPLPLFPITTSAPPTSGTTPSLPPQPLFPIRPPSQPLFPIEDGSTSHAPPRSVPLPPGPPPSSTMYAAGPNTGGPSIGPPPSIANKPPAPLPLPPSQQPGSNEVYLVWDDEMMSMEERRLNLPKYQPNGISQVPYSGQGILNKGGLDRRPGDGRMVGHHGFMG